MFSLSNADIIFDTREVLQGLTIMDSNELSARYRQA